MFVRPPQRYFHSHRCRNRRMQCRFVYIATSSPTTSSRCLLGGMMYESERYRESNGYYEIVLIVELTDTFKHTRFRSFPVPPKARAKPYSYIHIIFLQCLMRRRRKRNIHALERRRALAYESIFKSIVVYHLFRFFVAHGILVI